MALLHRDTDRVETTRTTSEAHELRPGERAGTAPGLVRALITLIGLAVAGLLVWLATTFDIGSTSGFWAAMGLIAAAGFVVGLSQLLGGWTKWGWPRLSPSVFLFAFLPTLILAGGILLAMRPTGDETDQVRGWAQDLGIEGLVTDFWEVPGVLAFAVGLVFAFCFDTSGPRTRLVGRDEYVRDEDVDDYRPVGATTATTDRSVADDLHSRDTDDDRTHVVTTSGMDERVEVRDRDRRDTI